MGRLINLTNAKFGRLTVLRLHADRSPSTRQARWVCACDCGQTVTVLGNSLRSGVTSSCGCLQKERAYTANLVHGHTSEGHASPEYRSYYAMLDRCYNEAHVHYADYGGRGIGVCRRWRGEKGFENFLSDMGPRPKGTTLDRKNGAKGYSPGNTQWATKRNQTRNRRNAVTVTYQKQTRTLMEWSNITGISYETLKTRYRQGKRGAELFRSVQSRPWHG